MLGFYCVTRAAEMDTNRRQELNFQDDNMECNINTEPYVGEGFDAADQMLLRTLEAAGIDLASIFRPKESEHSVYPYAQLNGGVSERDRGPLYGQSRFQRKIESFHYHRPGKDKERSYVDIACMIYFVLMALCTMCLGQFLVLPVVYEDTPDVLRWRTWFTWYIFYNIMINYALIFIYSSPYESKSQFFAQAGLPQCDWSSCMDCEQPTPPRTHHCPLCQKCVLKRDHHCFFTGSCIGFYNQRHFIVMCFYCAVGCIYGYYLIWQLFCMEYYYPLSWDFWHFVLPATIIEWVVGRSSFLFVFLVTMFYLTAMTGLGGLAMFLWQMYLVITGLTTHEFMKGIRIYRGAPLREKIQGVFGPWFLVQFVIPMPLISIKGDGIEWTHIAKKI